MFLCLPKLVLNPDKKKKYAVLGKMIFKTISLIISRSNYKPNCLSSHCCLQILSCLPPPALMTIFSFLCIFFTFEYNSFTCVDFETYIHHEAIKSMIPIVLFEKSGVFYFFYFLHYKAISFSFSLMMLDSFLCV